MRRGLRVGLCAVAGIATVISLTLAASPAGAEAHHHSGHHTTRLEATLLAANEVSGGQPGATGRAVVTLDPTDNRICFKLRVTGLTSPATAAHIHQAPAGVNGPVVVTLSPPVDGRSSGCVTVDPALISAIAANPSGFYVNVHTVDNPGGALRGQLTP